MEDFFTDCPICCEEVIEAERGIFFCTCPYQICVFCYNKINEQPRNKACPSCRRDYHKDNIRHIEVPVKSIQDTRKPERRTAMDMAETSSTSRVELQNLVYITGLPNYALSEDILRREEWLGKFGKITKIIILKKKMDIGPNNSQAVFATYQRVEDAQKAIRNLDGLTHRDYSLKAAVGTTKFCKKYVENLPCPNPNCAYLHEEPPRPQASSIGPLKTSSVSTAKLPTPFLRSTSTPSVVRKSATKSEKDGKLLPSTAAWGSDVAKSSPSASPFKSVDPFAYPELGANPDVKAVKQPLNNPSIFPSLNSSSPIKASKLLPSTILSEESLFPALGSLSSTLPKPIGSKKRAGQDIPYKTSPSQETKAKVLVIKGTNKDSSVLPETRPTRPAPPPPVMNISRKLPESEFPQLGSVSNEKPTPRSSVRNSPKGQEALISPNTSGSEQTPAPTLIPKAKVLRLVNSSSDQASSITTPSSVPVVVETAPVKPTNRSLRAQDSKSPSAVTPTEAILSINKPRTEAEINISKSPPTTNTFDFEDEDSLVQYKEVLGKIQEYVMDHERALDQSSPAMPLSDKALKEIKATVDKAKVLKRIDNDAKMAKENKPSVSDVKPIISQVETITNGIKASDVIKAIIRKAKPTNETTAINEAKPNQVRLPVDDSISEKANSYKEQKAEIAPGASSELTHVSSVISSKDDYVIVDKPNSQGFLDSEDELMVGGVSEVLSQKVNLEGEIDLPKGFLDVELAQTDIAEPFTKHKVHDEPGSSPTTLAKMPDLNTILNMPPRPKKDTLIPPEFNFSETFFKNSPVSSTPTRKVSIPSSGSSSRFRFASAGQSSTSSRVPFKFDPLNNPDQGLSSPPSQSGIGVDPRLGFSGMAPPMMVRNQLGPMLPQMTIGHHIPLPIAPHMGPPMPHQIFNMYPSVSQVRPQMGLNSAGFGMPIRPFSPNHNALGESKPNESRFFPARGLRPHTGPMATNHNAEPNKSFEETSDADNVTRSNRMMMNPNILFRPNQPQIPINTGFNMPPQPGFITSPSQGLPQPQTGFFPPNHQFNGPNMSLTSPPAMINNVQMGGPSLQPNIRFDPNLPPSANQMQSQAFDSFQPQSDQFPVPNVAGPIPLFDVIPQMNQQQAIDLDQMFAMANLNSSNEPIVPSANLIPPPTKAAVGSSGSRFGFNNNNNISSNVTKMDPKANQLDANAIFGSQHPVIRPPNYPMVGPNMHSNMPIINTTPFINQNFGLSSNIGVQLGQQQVKQILSSRINPMNELCQIDPSSTSNNHTTDQKSKEANVTKNDVIGNYKEPKAKEACIANKFDEPKRAEIKKTETKKIEIAKKPEIKKTDELKKVEEIKKIDFKKVDLPNPSSTPQPKSEETKSFNKSVDTKLVDPKSFKSGPLRKPVAELPEVMGSDYSKAKTLLSRSREVSSNSDKLKSPELKEPTKIIKVSQPLGDPIELVGDQYNLLAQHFESILTTAPGSPIEFDELDIVLPTLSPSLDTVFAHRYGEILSEDMIEPAMDDLFSTDIQLPDLQSLACFSSLPEKFNEFNFTIMDKEIAQGYKDVEGCLNKVKQFEQRFKDILTL